MLVRLLTLYFGSSFGYCEFHAGHPKIGGIVSCCKQVPCVHRDVITLTKNHDFDLTTPQLRGQKYLIQYRDFAPSVVSNFELFVRRGGTDSVMSFRKFASAEFSRYLGFVEKWVTSPFAQGQLVLNYNTFLQNPQVELQRTINFIEPAAKADPDRIAMAIAEVDGQTVEDKKMTILRKSGVHESRDVRLFRHYSPRLFQQIDGLRLPRQSVIEAFQTILGHEPAEKNMLNFQGFKNRGVLETYLKNSDEYRRQQLKSRT